MNDETTFTENPETKPEIASSSPNPIPTKETVQAQTTTTTTTTGTPKSDDTMIGGASGRFWIAMVFSLGFVAAVIISMYGKSSDATVFASFGATAGMVVGTYMGQHKAKSIPQ